jgi:hypothetical protein
MEGWVYVTSTTVPWAFSGDYTNVSGTNTISYNAVYGLLGAGIVNMVVYAGGVPTSPNAYGNWFWTPTLNTWYAFAFVRRSGVWQVYINGSALPFTDNTPPPDPDVPADSGGGGDGGFFKAADGRFLDNAPNRTPQEQREWVEHQEDLNSRQAHIRDLLAARLRDQRINLLGGSLRTGSGPSSEPIPGYGTTVNVGNIGTPTSYAIPGYIDEVRFSNMTRYATNYTPQTTALCNN